MFIFSSCKRQAPWDDFFAAGLPQEKEGYSDLVFTDTVTGYLGGDRTTSLGRTNGKNRFSHGAILYKTTDRGRSWHEIPVNVKGGVDRIIAFGDTVLLLLQDPLADSVYMLRSLAGQVGWETLYRASGKIYIRELAFSDATHGYFITDDREHVTCHKLVGKKTDTLLKFPKSYYKFRISGKRLISLSPVRNTTASDSLTITDLATLRTDKVQFDHPVSVSAIEVEEDKIYLAITDNKAGKILVVQDKKVRELSFGKYADFIPEDIFVSGETILVPAYRHEDAAFSGVIHNLLVSKDKGQTFTREEFPNPLIIKPAVLHKNFFITYCGIGRFQVRK